MSETPNDASRRQPPPMANTSKRSDQRTDGPAAPADRDSPTSAPAPSAPGGEGAHPLPATLQSPPEPPTATEATELARRPDRVAPSMAVGVMALLLICAALLLVAA